MSWRRFQLAAAAGALLCSLVACGATAWAGAGWPLATRTTTLLGFGSTYRAPDGATRTHSGVDLAADAGEHVLAPSASTVSFAGRIPADGGGTTLACTLVLADGTRLTLLPLESVRVGAGAKVAEGDVVGSLASDGDGSSAGAHLHVSARVNGLYVDPLGVLVAPAAVPSAPTAAVAPVTIPAAAAPAGAHSIASGHARAGGPALVIGVVPAPVASARPAVVSPRATAEGAAAARGGAAPAVVLAQPALASAAAAQPGASALQAALEALCARVLSATHGSWLPVIAAVLGISFGVALLLGARRATSHFERVLSDVTPVRDDVAAAVDRW